MNPNKTHTPLCGETRRDFLKKTVTASAAIASSSLLPDAFGAGNPATVAIVCDAEDAVVKQAPVQWAAGQLRDALTARGIRAEFRRNVEEAPSGGECILVSSRNSRLARQPLEGAGISVPDVPEALALVRSKAGGRTILLACGSDVRGLVYALLELADRVRLAPNPLADLGGVKRIVQKPANQIRSISRLFSSDVEDNPWFNDRAFWQNYLTELATQRFNRFHLALGLGYDAPSGVRDCYFYFAYPFLISPPGYNVRATPLPDAERERNLAMLRFISDEAALRGMHFQLGVWTHAYEWTNSPNANYVVEGLTPETQGTYCRDALDAVLKACPSINGVTFRIHGESGVAEGSYDLWKTIFDGVTRCGRRVEIDMHAKGIDQKMIDVALATGMPVNVSPKYWAEHMGLGYMQGAIRAQEMPPANPRTGFFSLSNGSRSFLRYGYGDLLAENRRHGVLHRLWPGTQRLLLWGNPQMAADYGRASSFCGSAGVEWMEPLTFKGRKGSGLPGGRDGYADSSLRPAGGDFEKYRYSYRVWGRHMYDPDCAPDEWRRQLNHDFGRGSASVETTLREAGGILPLFTTAHCPSAANNNYWPEMYWNMPVVDPRRRHPYTDTPAPRRFGAVSSLDPEFFSRIDDFAAALLKGEPNAKYSPAWVAAELESHARRAKAALVEARSKAKDSRSVEFRRIAADTAIQSGLGYFFAWKLRAGVLFALYDSSKDRKALEQALIAYRTARAAWAELAEGAKVVYRSDITVGPDYFQRGHWLDRLPAIDGDIADMEKLLTESSDAKSVPPKMDSPAVVKAIDAVLRQPADLRRPTLNDFHLPPKSFRHNEPLAIEASMARSKDAPNLNSLRLRFRRVNQAETWQEAEMELRGSIYHATIPAGYTDSPFPLQYHFELRGRSGSAWLHPGLKPGWQGQPYFVVRQSA